MRNRPAEISPLSLPHIRQRCPAPQVHARPASRRIRQNRQYSREWSVVAQRGSGSHPWSAVIINMSERLSSGKTPRANRSNSSSDLAKSLNVFSGGRTTCRNPRGYKK